MELYGYSNGFLLSNVSSNMCVSILLSINIKCWSVFLDYMTEYKTTLPTNLDRHILIISLLKRKINVLLSVRTTFSIAIYFILIYSD